MFSTFYKTKCKREMAKRAAASSEFGIPMVFEPHLSKYVLEMGAKSDRA